MDFNAPRPGQPTSTVADKGHATHPLFEQRTEVAGKETVYQATFRADRPDYLGDRQVFGAVVVPAATLAELALSAGQDRFGEVDVTLAELVIQQPLPLAPDHSRLVQVVVSHEDSVPCFQIYSQGPPQGRSGGVWSLHASGKFVIGAETDEPVPVTLATLGGSMTADVDVDRFYETRQASGLTYGPAFRCVQKLKCGAGEALGEVRLPEPLSGQADNHSLHPVLLDGSLQVLLAAIPESKLRLVHLPVGLQTLRVYRPGVTSVWSHARIRSESTTDGNRITADIRLVDAEEKLVATIQGLELRRTHRGMLTRQLRPPQQDWLYRLDWQVEPPKPVPAPVPNEAGSCLILADAQGFGVKLAEQLRSCGQRCVVVQAAERFAKLSQDEFQVCPGQDGDMQHLLDEAFGDDLETPQRVVHLWSLNAVPFADLSHDTLERSLRTCCETTLNLLHVLVKNREKHPPRLWLVTRCSQAIDKSLDRVEPVQACLWGMARVIGWEHPSLHPVRIDLDPERLNDDGVADLVSEVLGGNADDEVAFRQSKRFVPRLASCVEGTPDAPAAQEFSTSPIRDDGTYLVTGGLGGLGRAVAEWLVERGARSLLLCGRRQPSAEARQTIARLEHEGAEVTVINADVSVRADVDKLLNYIRDHLPPLAGIFHAAGTLDDGVLMQQDWRKFQRVLAAKVAGALHLHQATAEVPLDLFVNFSSVASMLGSPGQANYAAANAFLDALAHRRAALGKPALSVNWGPWDAIGMTADYGQRERARWEVGGISTIPVDQGLDILEQLLGQAKPQIGVLPITWSNFLKQLPGGQGKTLLAEVAKYAGSESLETNAQPKRSAILGKLREAPGERRAELVRTYVLERIAATLGVTVERLDVAQPLMATGLDSIMVLELKGIIESDLEITLSLESLVADTSAKDLADKVADIAHETLGAERLPPDVEASGDLSSSGTDF
jgi:acyl transferase domain-containing protein/acyl carrier protein